MTFSDWIDLDSLRSRVRMQRVSDGSRVEGIVERVTGRAFEFVPWHQLIGGEQYRIDVDSGLVSAGGDTMPSFSWSFISAWGDEPGAIEGVLAGGNHLVLEVVAAGSGSVSYSFRIDSEGPYHLEPIAPGRYTVAAYRDANGNGVWDGLGEAYGASPGVVEVRPGLTTDGVDIDVLP
jgi:hypothetical protein